MFYIYINNEKRLKVDILASGSRYLDVVLNFRANRSVNLTMIKASNLSQLGPICNGYEILKALPRVKETATEEGNFTRKICIVAEFKIAVVEKHYRKVHLLSLYMFQLT